MNDLFNAAGRKRFAVLAGITFVLAAAWLSLSRPGVDVVEEFLTPATMIEVVKAPKKTPSGRALGPAIVLVELRDGGQAKVFLPPSRVTIGEETPVTVKRYSDGSERVVAAPAMPE